MDNLRLALCLSGSILVTLASFGCGSGNYTPPLTAVTATSNPLVASYNIRHGHAGVTAWVEFGTDTTYGRQTSVMTDSLAVPRGHTLSILVAGMKPQTTYHMRAHVDWTGGSFIDQDQTFTTGPLPASLIPPGITITNPTPNLSPAPGVELLSLIAPVGSTMLSSVVTDLQGNIIWYYPAEGIPVKFMQNGHFVLNLSQHLREIDLAGNTIRDISVSQVNQSLQKNGYSFVILNFSHDVLTLPNGHWITIGQISKNFTDLPGYPGTTSVLGDSVVDIDPNGNVAWGWSAFDYLDVNRHLQGLPDWTHSNALVYTPDGNLLLSMRHQSWILNIDYANGTGSGAILWKLGEDGDFTLSGGDPSQWFYGQHYPNLLSTDGSQLTLAVYDDGNLRIDSDGIACGSTASAPACYSRATIFQIDESTNNVNLLWQDSPGYYSFWGGSVRELSNGDIEFDSSEPFPATPSASQISEVTYSGNPQTVWQMNITGENAYRGYRIPSLYPGVTWLQ
ncbi:MAG: aryl-sulfate sulfotransferase [Candidatus Sulfotelmatobacter sp.]